MDDATLLALVLRIGYSLTVEYAAGRWQVTAQCPRHERGPGTACGPTLALAISRLADKSDALNARLAAETAECDAQHEREDAARLTLMEGRAIR